MELKKRHPFSWQAIARIIAAMLIVFLVWKSLGVFVVILISLVIAAALYPIARTMNRYRVPMVLSSLVVIVFLLVPIGALVAVTWLSFASQSSQVLTILTPLLAKFHLSPNMLQSINVETYVRSNLDTFLNSTKEIGLAITSILTTIFLTFYFMLDAERLFALFVELFPKKERTNIRSLFEEVARVTGQYIRGNLFISLICIAIIYSGLLLLKIPFALPIAIFTGIMDLLPLIGPVIGAVPAVILGFAISPITGLFVLILYIAYKEVEDVLIGPAIYNKALNLSPALVFLSVVIGAGVFGVLGAFLALPVAASIPVIFKYRENYLNRHPEKEKSS